MVIREVRTKLRLDVFRKVLGNFSFCHHQTQIFFRESEYGKRDLPKLTHQLRVYFVIEKLAFRAYHCFFYENIIKNTSCTINTRSNQVQKPTSFASVGDVIEKKTQMYVKDMQYFVLLLLTINDNNKCSIYLSSELNNSIQYITYIELTTMLKIRVSKYNYDLYNKSLFMRLRTYV